MIEVRKACLTTLETLRTRAADSNITYLKSANVLPLFYYFLQDSCADIRQVGSQGGGGSVAFELSDVWRVF